MGSSDSERSFSMLNDVLKTRYSLSSKHIEEHIRLRFNGPVQLNRFRAIDYAKFWVIEQKRKRVDDFSHDFVEKIESDAFEDPNYPYYARSKLFLNSSISEQ